MRNVPSNDLCVSDPLSMAKGKVFTDQGVPIPVSSVHQSNHTLVPNAFRNVCTIGRHRELNQISNTIITDQNEQCSPIKHQSAIRVVPSDQAYHTLVIESFRCACTIGRHWDQPEISYPISMRSVHRSGCPQPSVQCSLIKHTHVHAQSEGIGNQARLGILSLVSSVY